MISMPYCGDSQVSVPLYASGNTGFQLCITYCLVRSLQKRKSQIHFTKMSDFFHPNLAPLPVLSILRLSSTQCT